MSDPLMAGRVDSTKVRCWIWPWALVVVFTACGPPLTQPSTVNLTGRWTSVDHVGPVFNMELVINQNPDGTIAGTWSSDVAPPNPPCPPELSDRAVGPVNGRNTVLAVQLSLVGAGDFQGQAIANATLRGSILSCGNTSALSFSRAGPAPTG